MTGLFQFWNPKIFPLTLFCISLTLSVLLLHDLIPSKAEFLMVLMMTYDLSELSSYQTNTTPHCWCPSRDDTCLSCGKTRDMLHIEWFWLSSVGSTHAANSSITTTYILFEIKFKIPCVYYYHILKELFYKFSNWAQFLILSSVFIELEHPPASQSPLKHYHLSVNKLIFLSWVWYTRLIYLPVKRDQTLIMKY